jgi:hypothetical protein
MDLGHSRNKGLRKSGSGPEIERWASLSPLLF